MEGQRRAEHPGADGAVSQLRLLLAVAAGLAACDAPPPAPVASEGRVTVQDSGGVRVVTSSSPRYPSGLSFRLERRPALVIGSLDRPGQILGRPVDATRLSDGRILVLDGQSQEVLVFDASGQRVATWGSEGQGPGDFTAAWLLQRLPGDTVAVIDRGQMRTTFFTPEGKVVRTQRHDFDFRPEGRMPAQSCCVPLGVIASGKSLWRYPQVWHREGTGDRPVTTTLVRSGSEGTDTLGDYSSGTAGHWPDGVNPVIRKEFAPELTVGLFEGGARLAMGTGETLGYEVVDPVSGLLTLVVRALAPRRAVDDELIERWRQQIMGSSSPESTSDRRQRLLQRPVSDSVAWFWDLKVSEAGEVWLMESPLPPGPPEESAYQVFSESGEWLGRAVLPEASLLFEVGADHLLRWTVGEYGESYIELWELGPA